MNMKNSISFSGHTPALAFMVVVLSLPAHGGGTVNFGNNSSNRIFNAHNGAIVTAAENLVAALYWSPLASNNFVQLGPPVPVGIPRDGIFVGGTRLTGEETAGGTSGKFQVRVWRGDLPSYEAAVLHEGLKGQSFVFVNPTGNSTGAPPAPPESLLAGGLASFAVSSNSIVQPPHLTVLADKLVACDAAWSFDTPAATDGCTGAGITATMLATLTNGSCPMVITRIWSVTNLCNGDFVTTTQTVTVVDSVAPQISGGSDKTVACGQAWEFDQPTTMDACSASSLAIVSTITNSLCPLSVTRTWDAWDACGNTNSWSQTLTGMLAPALALLNLTNQIVFCTNDWAFDVPVAVGGCGDVLLEDLGTVTNSLCPLSLTRSWRASNECQPTGVTGHQSVLVLCPSCPVLELTLACPPHPVPPGGTLVWSGTLTNLSDLTISNVVVSSDQPPPGAVAYGPITLAPGEGTVLGGSYSVPGSSGPHVATLTATGTGLDDLVLTTSATFNCAGTDHVTPGDMNGDGVVNQAELDAVLANYWAHSPWVAMTNPTLSANGRFQFELTNAGAWEFTVLVSTNATDWTNLPAPAFPVYQFVDPEAPDAPQRLYRLQWP
jgi:hypothetical protein